MATFEVREIFRLASRREFVIAGTINDGIIRVGMAAQVVLQGELFWSIPIKGIEYIDRIALKESLVGLVCGEQTDEDASLCSDLCPMGTVIEVKDSDA